MECYTYLRNIQDLLADGKTPYERRFGEPFKGPTIPCGAMVENHPISARDQSRIHQFGKNVLPGIFLGYEPVAAGIWKGDILIADLEDLEKLDASEIYSSKNYCKGSIDATKERTIHIPSCMYSKIVRKKPRIPRTHSEAGTNCKERRSQWRISRRTRRSSTDRIERWKDFWSIQGDFIFRHHHEPGVQLYVPKEETFPIPLKYIDVTRSTHTDLDVQEKRIDDYWNVDSNKKL